MQTTELEIIPANELVAAVQKTGLEPTTGERLVQGFAPYFRDAKAILDVSRSITVTDATQVSEIRASRENRLKLRAVRVAADKTRAALKEDSKRLGDAIQGVYNLLVLDISAEEKRLQDAEDFAERAEAARKEKLKQDRLAILAPYQLDLTGYDLAGMSDAGFTNLVESTKMAIEARRIATEKAEAERIERERIAAEEAARLKAEQDARIAAAEEAARIARAETEELARVQREKDAAAKAELARIEAIAKAEREAAELARKEAERLAREEQIKRDAEIIAERARVKAEADAREAEERKARQAAEMEAKRLREEEAARRMAEERAKADAIEAARRAAQAPDKEKLLAFADVVAKLTVPMASTDQGRAVAGHIQQKCANFSKWIVEQANAL